MKTRRTELEDLLIIEPNVFDDDRGFFFESWSQAGLAAAGIDAEFVQDNHSRSSKGVLRGLHFQLPDEQGKLVRVARGTAWDVAVDLRRSSPTFGRWAAVELSDRNHQMLWVPAGFAHGFLALEDGTDLLYKCTAPYAPAHEHILAWDDPELAIEWPLAGSDLKLSDKDRMGTPLSQIATFA